MAVSLLLSERRDIQMFPTPEHETEKVLYAADELTGPGAGHADRPDAPRDAGERSHGVTQKSCQRGHFPLTAFLFAESFS